jgi:RNA polymerase sigma-70 factor (ECF subfamily)
MDAEPGDAYLLEAVRRVDSTAFGVLLERHYPALVRVCLRLVHEPTLAEDSAQDAAIVAWLRLNQAALTRVVSGWLKGIGRHTCRHALHARSSASSNNLELSEAELCGDELPIYSELPQILRGAVDDLPPGARAAVRAFYVGGSGYAGAAGELGISVSAHKVRLHNASELLRYRFRLRILPFGKLRVPRGPSPSRGGACGAVLSLWSRATARFDRTSLGGVDRVRLPRSPGAPRFAGCFAAAGPSGGEIATLVGRAGLSGGDQMARPRSHFARQVAIRWRLRFCWSMRGVERWSCWSRLGHGRMWSVWRTSCSVQPRSTAMTSVDCVCQSKALPALWLSPMLVRGARRARVATALTVLSQDGFDERQHVSDNDSGRIWSTLEIEQAHDVHQSGQAAP